MRRRARLPLGRVQYEADGLGVEGQGHVGVHRRGAHRGGGVGEDRLVALSTVNSDRSPYSAKLRREPVRAVRRGRGAGDLGEGLMAAVGLGEQDRSKRQMCIRAVCGSRERRRGARCCRRASPRARPRAAISSSREAGRSCGEVSVDDGNPVVDEKPGGVQDLEGRADVAAVARAATPQWRRSSRSEHPAGPA